MCFVFGFYFYYAIKCLLALDANLDGVCISPHTHI
jgi:hypothetical protein